MWWSGTSALCIEWLPWPNSTVFCDEAKRARQQGSAARCEQILESLMAPNGPEPCPPPAAQAENTEPLLLFGKF